MSARYVVGQPVVLTCSFTVAGVLTNPTTVSVTITSPAGVVTTYTFAAAEILRPSTGVHTFTLTANAAGVWSYVWVGTGPAADVQSGTFTVFAVDPLRTLYCTLDETKEWLGIAQTDVRDDARLQAILGASSRWVDGFCHRRFWLDPTATARTYIARDGYWIWVDDIGSLTDFAIAADPGGDGTFETAWLTTDYQLHPENAPYGFEPEPWDQISAVGAQLFPLTYRGLTREARVRVTARWGWPAVPDAVKQACLMQTARLFKRKASPEGVAGFGEFGVVRVSRVDPDVSDLLAPYVLARIGASH